MMGDADEFRFKNASTHEGHLFLNDVLIWFGIETTIMLSYLEMMKGC